MGIRLSEHKTFYIRLSESEDNLVVSPDVLSLRIADFERFDQVRSKLFNNSSHRYIFEKREAEYQLKADYCIGIDWLGKTGRYLYVEPKINHATSQLFIQKLEYEEDSLDSSKGEFEDKHYELDCLNMLLQVTSVSESNREVKDLVQIDWDSQQISIEQKDDKLTPFLIIRFLQTLKSIVRKGLKKNYYKVSENLNNRIKGKILVGKHIKQNVFKNRFTSTYCEYQVFGEDHIENKFLKKVLQFVISYVESHKELLSQNYNVIQDAVNYCKPAFELISADIKDSDIKSIKHNPFYSDYKDAVRTGGFILKKFAYNITKTTDRKVLTPPFWIDMPRLFELYVYSKMVKDNSDLVKEIHYQFATYGNALDILVSHADFRMVIDAKYKLHYKAGHLHQDIRQVAGYARLNKVRKKLKVEDDINIDCLIIYPDMDNGVENLNLQTIDRERQEIKTYHKVYKLGVRLPIIL